MKDDYEGTCGQCGAPIHGRKCLKFERAWEQVECGTEVPSYAYLDAVAAIFPCGHQFIVRKTLWKRPDGTFVFALSPDWPKGRGSHEKAG